MGCCNSRQLPVDANGAAEEDVLQFDGAGVGIEGEQSDHVNGDPTWAEADAVLTGASVSPRQDGNGPELARRLKEMPRGGGAK